MNRADLEKLDRESLIGRAEEAGVTRARILTRPELVDELLIRSTTDSASREQARGLFGLARDLLARVVERGLHLPDAAERIRALGLPPVVRRGAPAALPTVTLAEIYAAQGHRDRAIETLEGVLVRESDHAAARALLAQLRDETYSVPLPRLPPEKEDPSVAPPANDAALPEPMHMLDDAPLPPRYDVDECVAIPVDPTTLYAYWEVRDLTLEFVRAPRPDGVMALRVIVIVPTWDGPQSTIRDHDVHSSLGDYFVRDLPAGCVVRAAIGWRHGDTFVPIAHSPALETPPGAPSPLVADVLVRWTPRGACAVAPADHDAASILRALGRLRLEVARQARERGSRGEVATGTSERWTNAPSSAGT